MNLARRAARPLLSGPCGLTARLPTTALDEARRINYPPASARRFASSSPASATTTTAQNGGAQRLQPRGGATRAVGLFALLLLLGGVGTYQYTNGESGPKGVFDAPRFAPFEIVGREQVSPSSIILTVRPRNWRTQPRILSPSTEGLVPSTTAATGPVRAAAAGLKTDLEGAIDVHDPYAALWRCGLWSVEIKQPQLQICRSYTPLPPFSPCCSSDCSPYDLRFLIRQEPRGEVSTYLHQLPVGAPIFLRGPHLDYAFGEAGGFHEIIFLAGGTGIAPALQAAYTVLQAREGQLRDKTIHGSGSTNERCSRIPMDVKTDSHSPPDMRICPANSDDHPKTAAGPNIGSSAMQAHASAAQPLATGQTATQSHVQILWANRSRTECQPEGYMVRELAALQGRCSRHRLGVQYAVDGEGACMIGDRMRQFVREAEGVVGERAAGSSTTRSGAGFGPSTTTTPPPQKLILVSGPDGFVCMLAGPKVWAEGQERQGRVGGVLGREGVGMRGWRVWKM